MPPKRRKIRRRIGTKTSTTKPMPKKKYTSLHTTDKLVYTAIPEDIKTLPEKELLKRFNNCFKSTGKHILVDEATNSMYQYLGKSTYYPSDVIITLINSKFKFLLTHFNKFVSSICYGDERSWLCNLGLSDPTRKLTVKYKIIINYFFSYFTPTNSQLNMLCKKSCYSKYKQSILWLECLINSGFKIPEKYYRQLMYTKFDLCSYILKNNISLNEDAVKTLLANKCSLHINKVAKLIKIIKLNDPSKCLNMYITDVLSNNTVNSNFKKIFKILISKGASVDNTTFTTILNSETKNYLNILIILQEFINNHIILPNEFIEKLLKKYDNSDMLLFFVLNNIKVTTDMVNMILWYTFYIPLPNKKVLKELHIDPSLMHTNNDISPDKLFSYLKIKPNMDTLIYLFYHASDDGDINIISDLILNYNIIPDKDCLLAAMRTENVSIVKTLISYKIPVDDDVFDHFIKYCKSVEMLDLLIHNNITIDFDKITRLLRKGICLESLYNFDIDKGEQLYYISYIFGKLKQYKQDITVNPDKMELREMFGRANLSSIKKFMKEKNLKPDRYCLENSYNNTLNLDVNKFLINNGCDMTPNCLGLSRYSGYRWIKKKAGSKHVKIRYRSYRSKYTRVPRKVKIDLQYRNTLYDINKEAGIDHEYMAKEYDIDINN